MDDLSSKLTDILNDPDSMERVRQMAESILGGSDEPSSPPPAQPALADIADLGGALGSDDLRTIVSVISKMKSSGNDTRVQLIYALKPHLSDERKARADTAVKLLKLLDVMPLIKESGLLKL